MPKKKEGTSVKSASKHAVAKKSKIKSSSSVSSSISSPKSSKKKSKIYTPKVASEEHAFVTVDGKRLKTILELAHELDTMADHVFYHHVTVDRNDFSNWVRDVFKEQSLSEQIAKSPDKHNTHIVVLRHIVHELPEQ